METTTRNATLEDLAGMLQDQHARKVDVVAHASQITADNGRLVIANSEPVIDDDGVGVTEGIYTPTRVCDEGIAEKLNIPIRYVRLLRLRRPDLWDANVNGWLHGSPHFPQVNPARADDRSFLVRCFRDDTEGTGIARAFLSDRFRPIDNIDVLSAALLGIEDAGLDVVIDGCDLTERRMHVRIVAPQIRVMAEELLRGYRNPFGDGDELDRWRNLADREGLGYGGEEPVLFAGFVIRNSETGDGAFSLTPRAVFRVCKNGLTIKRDMVRDVHLGGRLDAGVIDWSADTQQQAVRLVRAKTRDAVASFLDRGYWQQRVSQMEAKAGQSVEGVETVKRLVSSVKITQDQFEGIIGRFVRGGQMTRGGVMNAITAHAQTLDDADTAADLEEKAAALVL